MIRMLLTKPGTSLAASGSDSGDAARHPLDQTLSLPQYR